MLVVFNITPPLFALMDYFALTQVQREVLLRMEYSGGLTQDMEDYIKARLESRGIDVSNVTIYGTHAVVDYGETVELVISYDYTYGQYWLSGFALYKTDVPMTMRTQGRSISLTFEK